ncbi:dihydroneopterin aldolase [Gaiella sp.]|uniref:dihydroneopterin aldolase n=1 Tax=Gaiella sp. TaxID=2663207 RepID=UPI003983CBD1
MTIELHGILLHGYHGVLDAERRDGQRFLVDVELDLAHEQAARSDAIEEAVDYRRVVARVREVSDARAYHLLEAFSGAIADALLEDFPVNTVRVRVRKPDVELDPPVDYAAVAIERRRSS